MIEFKADCGHTVRARDEDAGNVVRCSYCGRNAPVPDNIDNEIDFLIREVEEKGKEDSKFNRKARRSRKKKLRKKISFANFDPFVFALKMCYVAALIIIVVVITRLFVMPLFEDNGIASRFFQSTPKPAQPSDKSTTRRSRQSQGPGLIARTKANGIFVGSTPPGGKVYCLEQQKAPDSGRIAYTQGVRTLTAPDLFQRLPDGHYVVEVEFRWNDPHISNSSADNYQNYLAFRRSIRDASDEQRDKLHDDFFIPDESTHMLVEETADQIYLVRQYRNITVLRGKSKGVRSLFLPRIQNMSDSSFSIEALVTGYIPAQKQYSFDEIFVLNELAFYDVKQADRRFVIEALSRIGMIPYVTPNGDTRLFKIGVDNGEFATQIIRNATE